MEIEPPNNLAYATPEEKHVVPTHPAVGLIGFVLYLLLAALFYLPLVAIGVQYSRNGRLPRNGFVVAAVIFLIAAFCTWRAVAAMIGVVRAFRRRSGR